MPTIHLQLIVCAIALVSLFGPFVAAQGASNSWNEIPGQGNSPGPRVGHTTVLHDNKLYLFGGKNHLDQYLDDLWQFSFETISWTNIGGNRAQSYEEWFTIKDPTSALYRNVVAARPAGRFGHSAVIGSSFGTAGENVAVMTIFGGYSPNCTDFCNDMWHYVFASNSWIMLYGEWNGAGGEREAMYDYGKLNQTVPVRRWRHSGLKITDPGKDYLLIFGGNLPGNPAACCGYMCKETCPIKCSDAGFAVGQKFQSWNRQMFDSSNCTFANDLWKVNLQTFEAFESNLAVEKQVLMSSTEGFHLARLAIDGNPSTYAATLLESQPFWQCTLGAINFISSMVITNVPGKDRERLSNFYVFLSLEPFSSQRLQDLLLDPQVWKMQFMYAVSDTLTIQPMQTAGFVRIQLAGTNSLILPEVKINGYPPIQSWQNLQGIRKWTNIKPLDPSKAPGPRYGQASVYVEKFETVVVYGGFVAEHPYYLDDWWSFNTRTNAWFQILPKARQPMNVLPSGRSGHAMFYFHELRNTDTNELCEECPDLIFLNGGEQGSNRILDRNSQVSFSSSFVWDLWQYNMQTRVLSQMAFTAGPKPRSMHSATVYKNSVYIYGGRTDKPDASVASSSESCPNGICGDFWTYELGGSNPCPGRCGITKGKCLSGFCECLPRFSGADCGSLRCPGSQCVYDKENNRLVDCNDCSGNGICNNGKCQCNDGFKGETCGKVACPNDCSQHGTCKLRSGEGAVCDCDTGFATLDCSVAVCPDDCTLHSLESDGMEAVLDTVEAAVTENNVGANATNSTTEVVDDCRKRRANGVCALRKNINTGIYTSCVSWDQDSGQCNMYKEGVFRGECIDRGPTYTVDRTACICGDTFEGENCGISVASDALIEVATKDILSSAPIPGINVNISVVVSVPFILFIFLLQAVLCSIVVILPCILA